MGDVLTKEQRSYCMSQIKSKNTLIEISLRKFLWSKGIRNYRIRSRLIGRPDIIFPKYKIAVFIDGCFWHKCPDCYNEPKTNKAFWVSKIKKNTERDLNVNKTLKKEGWKVLRFWGHEIRKNPENIYKEIIKEIKRV